MKKKKCKGVRLAKRSGCGKEFIGLYKYGLCAKCFFDWISDPANKEEKERFGMLVSSRASANKKKRDNEQRVRLMSALEYRKKEVQPLMNLLIREIDKGHPCISSRRMTGQFHAGHYFDTASFPSLALHPFNIYIQTAEANHFRSADIIAYQRGLLEDFGSDHYERIQMLASAPARTLTKETLISVRCTIKEEIKSVRKMQRPLTNEERISVRKSLIQKMAIWT